MRTARIFVKTDSSRPQPSECAVLARDRFSGFRPVDWETVETVFPRPPREHPAKAGC